MKIAGIVAEYNPFHNGHAHHIERTRSLSAGCEATHVVAVMSGNFVQRGEPALLPKAERVRAALAGGVDLVVELPLPWALSSAEGFAFGAVSLLDALGCVDTLSFGSECGDLSALAKVTEALEAPRFSDLLHYHLDMGIAFPEARQRAVAEVAGKRTAELLSSPNNLLGIEYLKALRRLESSIIPFTIERFGAEHDARAPLGDVASASYIRTLVREGRLLNAAPYLPASVFAILSKASEAGRCPTEEALIERAVLARLRTLPKEALGNLPGLSEGLENRLYAAIRQAGTLNELAAQVKTRRYPMTRVKRLLWSAFLGIPAGYESRTPPYIRVLGVGTRGAEVLSAARGAGLPLLSRSSQLDRLEGEARAVWELESRAADLYALALPQPYACGAEYTTGLVRGME